MHRYFGLIEERESSPSDLHTLFADDFLLEFTMVTISTLDELDKWVASMHEAFAAYTLEVLDLAEHTHPVTGDIEVSIDLELHGITPMGERRELETRHHWTLVPTPADPFDRIRSIVVAHR